MSLPNGAMDLDPSGRLIGYLKESQGLLGELHSSLRGPQDRRYDEYVPYTKVKRLEQNPALVCAC